MLYLVYGTNREAVISKKNELVKSCRLKRPDAEVFVLSADNFSKAILENLSVSQGLFDKKHIVVLDSLFQEKDISGIVSVMLPSLKKSESVFILIEGLFDSAAKDEETVKKYAEKFFSFGVKKEGKPRDSSSFLITDAFCAKDKKNAWIYYQKSLRSGASPEEISGSLFWQIKSILLAKKTKNAAESGLVPFVYEKSSRFARNFSEKELDSLLEELIHMYHSIRMDGGSLEYKLEKFLLEK